MKLSPRQIESIRDCTARINLWEGAVRSGKTLSSLIAWLHFVAHAPRDGELVMVGRTKETVGRNLLAVMSGPLFGQFAKHISYTPGATFAVIFGRRVHILGANDVSAETRIRGLTLAGAYVDEATVIPEVFWQQLVARMSVIGARLFATTNPDSPAHWLKRDWLDRRDPEIRTWHFTLDDNHALDPDYVAYLKRQYTGLWYRRFILGLWVLAEGAIYDSFDHQHHTIDPDQIPAITRWLFAAVDYGTTNPFHAVLAGLGDDRRLYVTSEYRWDSRKQHRQMTDTQYSAALRSWLQSAPIPRTQLAGVRPEYVVIDPSATSFRVQLNQDGISSWAADNEVLDGIRVTNSLIAGDRIRISRACPELIGEITGYSWDPAAQAKGEDKPMKVNDHGADALRYGVKTTEQIWRNLVSSR